MIRKIVFDAIVMLPLLAAAQQKRTVMISHDRYNHSVFDDIVRHITSPFRFVDRIFHRQSNFVSNMHNRISFTLNRPGFSYSLPGITNGGNRIILNNRHIFTLPQRQLFINGNRSEIIIKKNGHTIYVNKDRRI